MKQEILKTAVTFTLLRAEYHLFFFCGDGTEKKRLPISWKGEISLS